jgi:hypothetical protein
MIDLATVTHEDLAPYAGSSFTLNVPDHPPVELTLDRVRVLVEKHRVRDARRDTFGIYFVTPPNMLVQQGTYTLSHPELGEMTIFVVPVGRVGDAFELEAVFT